MADFRGRKPIWSRSLKPRSDTRAATRWLAAAALLLAGAASASAQACPDFFRFVDFGLETREGIIQRGGPVFRAEGFDGRPLLLADRTECLNVRDLARDGRGNPVPVVRSVDYATEATGIDLAELRVAVVQDAIALANENARAHRAALDNSANEVTRGADFLCVRSAGTARLSCQVASPYGGNSALVIYCDAVTCTMPVLAIDGRLIVSARWEGGESYLRDLPSAGRDAVAKALQIRDFLAPLSSGL